MITTGTIDATGTKININWGALRRDIFISSLIGEYNVSAGKIKNIFDQLNQKYGNLFTDKQKEDYVARFCENTYDHSSYSWGETYLGRNDIISTGTITCDHLQWTDGTSTVWG
jgi:hypothetical protein